MSGDPRVSIIVVNWNSGEYLAACLSSLEAAGGDLVSEIIVVDNASTDRSLAAVRGQSRVAVVASTENLGFGRGVQCGVKISVGNFVAVVNPDVVMTPGSLAAMVEFLEKHPEVGVVAPRTVDPAGRPAGGSEPLPTVWSGIAFFPLLGRFGRRRKDRLRRQEHAAPAGWVRGACLLFRRRALLDIGGFPTDTFMYGEEVLVGHRMRQAAWQIWYLPDLHVHHAKGVSSQRRWSAEERILQAHRGRATAMRQVLGPWRFRVWSTLVVAGLSLQWLITRISGREEGHPLRALIAIHRQPAPLADGTSESDE